MESFIEQKPQWPELVGAAFRIEGRYAILTRDLVRMRNCELPFKPLQQLKVSGTSKVIEVSGRLAKETTSGKLYFELDSIRFLPNDLQTLAERERAISRGMPKQWYELADWATARGKFYNDDELLERAKVINRRGLLLERQELKELTPQTLRQLSARVPELGLEDTLRLDWLHESLSLEWESLQKSVPKADLTADEFETTKDPLFQFLQRLDKDLPGAKTRADDVLPLEVNEYRRNSVLTYRNAADSRRRKFERLFHVEVATAAIRRITKPDDSNGGEVAKQLDELIPEQHDIAEQHRDRELAFLAKTSATLSRNQLGDLVQRCRDRKQEDLAKEAITRWLTRREQSLRKDGVTGLIQLADERLALLQDQPGAGALLFEALKLAPTNEDIHERLTKLGYQKVNDQWVQPQAVPQTPNALQPGGPETDLERNIRLGVPTVGMTAAQLLKCLGSPQSLTRVATSGRITESWTYRDGPSVRHTITIERQILRGTALVRAVQ
ncbi:MAG: hypothetical protein IAG10_18050 [Planctomycetaceae bacterium]|nr:hypothetical protein [Planctomycetaceae bacterium]